MAADPNLRSRRSNSDRELADARGSLGKLINGKAHASLPIRDLLRLCEQQQRQIADLQREVARLGRAY